MLQPNLTPKQKVIEVVRLIPPGMVANFGLIGLYCGLHGRQVGWILSGMLPQECDTFPWYRVVAKNGFISSLKLGDKGQIQMDLLKSEGYTVNNNSVDMAIHGLHTILGA